MEGAKHGARCVPALLSPPQTYYIPAPTLEVAPNEEFKEHMDAPVKQGENRKKKLYFNTNK
jgi:hypothetical protein